MTILRVEHSLPPIAMLQVQDALRELRPGEVLEIRVHSLDLWLDMERLLAQRGVQYRASRQENGEWRILVQK